MQALSYQIQKDSAEKIFIIELAYLTNIILRFQILERQVWMYSQPHLLPSLLNSKRTFIPKQYRQNKRKIESSSQHHNSSSSRRQHGGSNYQQGNLLTKQGETDLIRVSSFGTEKEEQVSEGSYDIGRNYQQHGNLHHLCQQYLDQIQGLNFNKQSSHELKFSFQDIVEGHIEFDTCYPIAISDIGRILLSDGLFHEMWGRVVSRLNFQFQSWLYYQRYANLIKKNHANFEAIFNQQSSTEVPFPNLNEINCDSNTNLQNRQKSKTNKEEHLSEERQQVRSESFCQSSGYEQQHNLSAKQNDEQAVVNQTKTDQNGRLRLLEQIQTNQRRLNAQIVCYFLQIRQCFRLQDIEISNILETAWGNNSQMILYQGHLKTYSHLLKKEVIKYQPKVLITIYGEVNLKQLLRIKLTYGTIHGFVVYDQNFAIKNWLRGQRFDIGDNCILESNM